MAKYELMTRSLRSLHNIPLRFGLNSWSSFAIERSAQMSALHSAASALRSRMVRAALNSWIDHAVASAEAEHMVEGIWRCFSWRGFVMDFLWILNSQVLQSFQTFWPYLALSFVWNLVFA